MEFKNLLRPGRIGRLEVRNRMVMPGMGTNLAAFDGTVTDAIVAYYAKRASGGVGLIITEVCAPEVRGKVIPGELEISEFGFIPGLSRLVAAAHSGGAKIALQLAHGGCFASKSVTGHVPISPSGVKTSLLPDDYPEAMSVEQIKDLIQKYGLAAQKGKMAGFDAIELHGAHGYMPLQFLSSYTNRRNDEYGGSLKNRARFALETIRVIKEIVGEDFPLIYRLSAHEDVPGGLRLEEAVQFAKWAQEAGVDAIHVSAGTWDSRTKDFSDALAGKSIPEVNSLSRGISIGMWVPPIYVPRGILVGYAETIKQSIDIPVIAVCGLSPEMAEDVISEAKADFVAMGRQIIADPDYPNKVRMGEPGQIRRCVRCNECLGSVLSYNGLRCGVNPEAGKEHESFIRLHEPSDKKKITVIGGGPAGMEAARVAAARGHEVTLHEKSNDLGGMLRYLAKPVFKKEFMGLFEWQLGQLSRNGVEILLGSDICRETIESEKPDAIILATGANVVKPKIKGVENTCTENPLSVLEGKIPGGHQIVICGGGLFGVELAMYLAEEHAKKVTIIERMPDIASEVEVFSRMIIKAKMMELGVEIKINHDIKEIKNNGSNKIVVCNERGQTKIVTADSIILALGMESDRKLHADLRDIGIEIHLVGDVMKPGKIINAIHDGYHAGRLV